jgi:acetyl-CoA C-acetyltransferase
VQDPIILSAVRTPIGRFLGVLSSLSATKLGALVVAAAVDRAGVPKDAVDEVIMGNVMPVTKPPCGGTGQMLRHITI